MGNKCKISMKVKTGSKPKKVMVKQEARIKNSRKKSKHHKSKHHKSKHNPE